MTLPPLPSQLAAFASTQVLHCALNDLVQAYGQQCREELKAELAQALCSDCENGIKWLNEQALKRFQRDFPSLWGLLK